MLSIHIQPHECFVCYHNYCNKINSSESYSPLMIAAWVSEVWLTLSILGSCLLPRKVIFGPIPIMDPYLITKYGKTQGQLTPRPSILQVHQFLFFIIIRSARNQSVWGGVWLWGKRVYSCVDVRVLVYYVHVSMSSVHIATCNCRCVASQIYSLLNHNYITILNSIAIKSEKFKQLSYKPIALL